MRNYPEYQLCKQIAYYLKAQYPNVIFHFDYAGLNLSKAQAGKMKVIQGKRGFPDLTIYEPMNGFKALMIELKPEGTKLYNKDKEPVNEHIAEQLNCLLELKLKGYKTAFGVGFDNTRQLIDDYLNGKL